jgi:hypothetical protein
MVGTLTKLAVGLLCAVDFATAIVMAVGASNSAGRPRTSLLTWGWPG